MRLSTFIKEIEKEIDRIGDINIHQIRLIAKHLDFNGEVTFPTSVRLEEREDSTYDIVLFRQGGVVVDGVISTNKEKVEYLEEALMIVAKDLFGNYKHKYSQDELARYVSYAVAKAMETIKKRRNDETFHDAARIL